MRYGVLLTSQIERAVAEDGAEEQEEDEEEEDGEDGETPDAC